MLNTMYKLSVILSLFQFLFWYQFCLAQLSRTNPEELLIKPNITYRQAFLKQNKESVYHHEDHKDYLDQIYLSLKFIKKLNFQHEVLIEPAIRTPRTNPKGNIETVIDQAYVQSSLDNKFFITAGKKSEFYGYGFFDNPSDLLNEKKDMFDDLYKKEGKIFTKLSYNAIFSSNKNVKFSIGFIPKRADYVNTAKRWLLIESNFLDTDLEIQYTHNKLDKSTFGLAVSRFFTDKLELHFDGRYQTRQRDNSDERDSEDKQREMEFSSYKHKDSSAYYLLGTRLVFTSKQRLVLEYIKNQSGLLQKEKKEFYQNEKSKMVGDTKTDPTPISRIIGRNYLCLGYQDENFFSKKIKIGASGIYSMDDKSNFVYLELKYVLSAISYLSLVPTFFSGKQYTEFGEMPFKQVTYFIIKGEF